MTINCFNDATPEEVRGVLLRAQLKHTRVRVFYGDPETGIAWHEEHFVTGTVSNSTGRLKIPLLIHNARSHGSPAMLDHCIVAIRSRKAWLYRHPHFSAGNWTVGKPQSEGYEEGAYVNCVLQAQFEKPGQAKRYCGFMSGMVFGR